MNVRAMFAGALGAAALTAGLVSPATATTATTAANTANTANTANAANAANDVSTKASFTVWATDVNVRDNPQNPGACDAFPSPGNCPAVSGKLQPGDAFEAACQKQGENVHGNPWWVYISRGDTRGFIASHYVDHPADQLPGVPVCGAKSTGAAAPRAASAQSAKVSEVSEAAEGKPVQVWATNVKVHVEPSVGSPAPATVSRETLIGFCQRLGDRVSEPGQGASSWWTQVEKPGGSDTLWISNVYLVGGEKIEGIPDC